MRPKISVIVPVYNVENYIEKCLKHLCSQTLHEIEIICINDGATDKSPSILSAYAKKDSRIILLSQENKGPGAARNAGIEIAKGEYIGFVDPDDYVDFDFFEKLYNCAIKNNIDIVKGNVKILQNKEIFYSDENFAIKKEKGNIPLKSFRTSWWTAIYKNTNINTHKIRFAETFYLEDVAFLDKNLLVAKSFKALDDTWYYHCIRSNSLVTRKIDDSFKFKQFYLSYKDIIIFLNCLNLFNIYKYYMNEIFYSHIIYFFCEIYKSKYKDNLDNCKYIKNLLENIDMSILKKKYRKNLELILLNRYDELYDKIKSRKRFKFIEVILIGNKLFFVVNLYFKKFKLCLNRTYYK